MLESVGVSDRIMALKKLGFCFEFGSLLDVSDALGYLCLKMRYSLSDFVMDDVLFLGF